VKKLISTKVIPFALLGLALVACKQSDSKDEDDDNKKGAAGAPGPGGQGGSGAGGGGQAGNGQAGGGQAGGGQGGGGTPVELTLVDCVSPDNLEDAKCTKRIDASAAKVGSGPRFANFSGGTNDVRLGFLSGSLLTVAIETGSNTDDKGVIGTVDIVTGERKVLSGKYEDPAEGTVSVGEGPTLNEVFGVTHSKSGKLLATVKHKATDYGIVSIDPANGNRTEVLTFEGSRAPCDGLGEGLEGDVLFAHRSGLAEGPDGELYVHFSKDLGSGIARIDADKKCKVLTYTSSDPNQNVGEGANVPNSEYNNLTLHDGFIWSTLFVGESVLKIDIKTGKRTKISSSFGGGSIGEGPKLGTQSIGFDGDKVWTAGDGQDINIVFIDTADEGKRTLLSESVAGGPLVSSVSGTPGLWPVPGTRFIVTEVGNAIVVFDPQNNNSNVISF
jgi:hypothetical protein